MYCRKCGTENSDSSRYCRMCGERLGDARKLKRFRRRKIYILAGSLGGTVLAVALVLCLTGLWGKKGSGLVLYEDNGSLYAMDTKKENISTDAETGLSYANNELLITAVTDTPKEKIEKLAASYGGTIVGYIEVTDTFQIQFPQKYTYEELKTIEYSLEQEDIVSFCELNLIIDMDISAYTPNDSEWVGQWDEVPEGSNWGLEAIQAPEAWEYKDQMAEVNVGVYDNVFLNHEDLEFTEILCNEHDLDNLAGVNQPYHGTAVSGILGAEFDNDKGICGTFPKASLFGVSFRKAEEYMAGSIMAMKVGFTYLIHTKQCKVINMSIGWEKDQKAADQEQKQGIQNGKKINEIIDCSNILETYLKQLISLGDDFVICKAAGNLSGVDASYDYIAAIDDPEVMDRIIVVGAAQNEGNGAYTIADFSCWGNRVDVVAPGVDIYTTMVDSWSIGNWYNQWSNKYHYQKGTSSAAPFVSGIAAMVYSVNPDLNGIQVKDIICRSAEAGGMISYSPEMQDAMPEGVVYEYPMVNALAAVEMALNDVAETEMTEDIGNEEDTFTGEWTAAYTDVLQQYYDGIQNDFANVDPQLCKDGSCPINYPVSRWGLIEGSDIYFSITDIDSNGTPELILGEGKEENSVSILSIFTYADQTAVRVWDIGERSDLYLCEGGIVYEFGAGGAASSYYRYYVIGEDNKSSVMVEYYHVDGTEGMMSGDGSCTIEDINGNIEKFNLNEESQRQEVESREEMYRNLYPRIEIDWTMLTRAELEAISGEDAGADAESGTPGMETHQAYLPVKETGYLNGEFYTMKEYTYDEYGRVKTSCEYEEDGSKGIKIQYIYDDLGNLVEELWSEPGIEDMVAMDIRRFYDSAGNKVYESQLVYEYQELKLTYEYQWEYDENGNMIRQQYNSTWADGSGDGVASDFRYEYEYDGNGNVVTRREYGSDQELRETINYIYDEQGRKKTVQTLSGDGRGESEEQYTYDEHGSIVSAEQHVTYTGHLWIPAVDETNRYSFDYTYDVFDVKEFHPLS